MSTLLTSTDDNGVRADAALAWPDARTLMGDTFYRDWDRRLKFRLRLLWTRRERAELLQATAQLPFGRALLRTRPQAFYPLMTHLLHRGLGPRQRLQAMVVSMRRMCAIMPAHLNELLGGGVVLDTLGDGTQVVLGLSAISFHEGLWQVAIMDTAGRRLYSAGFGFIDERTLFIGNVQGIQNCPDALTLLRDLTHVLHGLRAPHYLMLVMRQLAQSWGIETLMGVGPRTHVKGGRLLKPNRLWFDYPAFWEENGGAALPDGNWTLPVQVPRRPIEDVPSKRRAEHRRRYAMLDGLAEKVEAIKG